VITTRLAARSLVNRMSAQDVPGVQPAVMAINTTAAECLALIIRSVSYNGRSTPR